MNNSNACLLFLLLGGIGGYSLSGYWVPDIGGSGKNSLFKPANSRAELATSAQPSGGQNEASFNKDFSAAELIEELLLDFDSKSALKAAKKLSIKELKAVLALLAAMPRGQKEFIWTMVSGKLPYKDREDLRSILYIRWAAIDPQAAWQTALAESNESWNVYLLSNIASFIAKTEPLKAVDLALGLAVNTQRDQVLRDVLRAWSLVNLEDSLAYLNAHPETTAGPEFFSEALTTLAATDPLKAANLALTIKGLENQCYVLSGLLDVWVERDLAAALKWSQALTNTQLREDITSIAIDAWTKSDPVGALNYVQRITDNDTRIKSFLGAWGSWFDHSPQAAVSYLHTTQDENLLETVSHHILSNLSGAGSKERLEILTKFPEGPAKQQMNQSLVGEQVKAGQYNDALIMLNALPDSSERDRQVTQLGQAWAKADFPAATKWLKIQPASSDRDLALTGYALALAETNPTAAIREVNTIPDAALRRDALKVVAFRWYQADAVKAEAWMTGSSGFSEKDTEFVRFKAKVPGDYLPLTPTVGQRR